MIKAHLTSAFLLLGLISAGVHATKPEDSRSRESIPPKGNSRKVDMVPDGNCFYRALSYYLQGNQSCYSNVRQDIVNFMSDQEDRYYSLCSINSHFKGFQEYLRRHTRNKEWADEAIIQAAADMYGITIYIRSIVNSSIYQHVRASSAAQGSEWLHLEWQGNHYSVIGQGSSMDGAPESTNFVDILSIPSIQNLEYRAEPVEQVPKVKHTNVEGDDIDNICNGDNLKELFAEFDIEDESPEIDDFEPLDISAAVELLPSEVEERIESQTEVSLGRKPEKSCSITNLDDLKHLIYDGTVGLGSHFRVRRLRGFTNYHPFIREANDQSMTADSGRERIVGDGNCFYRCIAHNQHGDQNMHYFVRQAIITFMSNGDDRYHDLYLIHPHREGYTEYLSQQREDGVWAEEAIIQAAADLYGLDIYLTIIHGNSGGLLHVRTSSAAEASGWLHLELRGHHYSVIAQGSSRDDAPESTNFHDIYELCVPTNQSPEYRAEPFEQVPKVKHTNVEGDDIDNICDGLKETSLTSKAKGDNLKEFFAEFDIEDESPEIDDFEPLDISAAVEILPSEVEERIESQTEVSLGRKPEKSCSIKNLDDLKHLIHDGTVGLGSHFRVRRLRGFTYYHHFFIREANDQSMTVIHLDIVFPLRVLCKQVTVNFSNFNEKFLDFEQGLLLMDWYDIPINETAVKAMNCRIDEMLALNNINYSVLSPDKMFCGSLISYILTGEEDFREVLEFLNFYRMLAIFPILLVECGSLFISKANSVKNAVSNVKKRLAFIFQFAKLYLSIKYYSIRRLILYIFSNLKRSRK